MNTSILRMVALLALIAGLTLPLKAQETRSITLREAIEAARREGPGVTGSAAAAEAARQGRRREASGLLPEIGVDLGVLRSTDPVAAFGSRLRQGRFTEQDFNPALLNDPASLTDWNAGITVAWTPLNPSRMAAVDASQAIADAASFGASWAVRSAEFMAEVRFVEAVGAELLSDAAEAAVTATQANLALVQQRVEEGMLVEADRLRASAAAEAATADRINARRLVADARSRLGLALGWPTSVVPVPGDDTMTSTPATDRGRSLSLRPDLRASERETQAARSRLTQAQRARLPHLAAFARLESHAPGAISGHEPNWTVGLRVNVPVFTGFAITAAERAGRASAAAAEAAHQERLREAEARVLQARRAVEAADGQARASEAARAAANEAVRLVRLRFTEGLATTADLLTSEASAAGLASAAVRARLAHRLATARLEYLTDLDHDTNDLTRGLES